MSTALLVFVSTFVAVFALGLQSLNVNQGHYLAAAATSLLISAGHIALYRYLPSGSLPELAAYLAGGVTGITSSMWFHRRFKAWWRAWRAARARPDLYFGAAARPRSRQGRPACPACGLPEGTPCPRLVCERYLDEHATVSISTRLH
jgi:hypothetical protein